jgi:hypothetical protein
MDTFIQWPDADEITIAKQAFYERGRGFPCIAGLIDGSHVEVIGPHRPANEAAFVNRGGWHSINTQIIVCGPDLKIFDLDARWPGCSHDSFILQNSHVWDRFENGLVPDSWILGDSGYPQPLKNGFLHHMRLQAIMVKFVTIGLTKVFDQQLKGATESGRCDGDV